jgi:hypothetical protein
MSVIDPVAQPNEYQSMLLRYLGDQDPADVQEKTPGVIATTVAESGDLVRTRPEAGEWSVLELTGHLYDAELTSAARYRWVIAHDQPPLAPYDQDLWVERLRHNEDEPGELLESFGGLRRANLALWARTAPEERERVGVHLERGPESLDLMFRMLAGHDLFHIEQMNKTLASLRGA